jgi:hypothetical protein
MEVLTDELVSHKQMAIIERFGVFVDYIYPIAINIRRTHGVVRDMLITSMFEQANLFSQAGKTSQVSRLYAADAGMAHLRFQLRFLSDDKRRLISRHQCEVASVHLAEVGKMLGSWIRSKAAKG